MIQARHPNRLPDDQIMALVPAQYREGAKIIYSTQADSYRIYRVIGYEYKSDVQRTYVKRLTLGYIKQGKWIKSESFSYQEEIDELKTKLAAEEKKRCEPSTSAPIGR